MPLQPVGIRRNANSRPAALQEWITGLRASADIVDRREEVLQAATDTTSMPLGPFRRD